MALKWRGEQVKRSLARAGADGIDATMKLAVEHAQASHGAGANASGRFASQSGRLARSIKIVKRATTGRSGAQGRWGSVGVPYAARIELGFQGKDRLGRVYDTPGFPFLQPAQELAYPGIARRVRKAGPFA